MISRLLLDADYPDELISLYNPGYAGAIVLVSGAAYEKVAKAPFPLVYAYLAVPLVAIDECRLRLPTRVAGRMADWVHRNIDALIDFPLQAVALKPFVESGLVFLGSLNLLSITESGCHFTKHDRVREALTSVRLRSQAVEQEVEAAALLGRWLAREHDVSNVLAFLGIKP